MNQTTIGQAMKTAIQEHRAGRLAEAEKACRRILAVKGDHADALRLLGVIATQTGHLDAGIELIRKAIGINPKAADYYIDLGNGLRNKGEIDEAIAAFERAVGIDPSDAVGHSNLGVVLGMSKQLDRAVREFNEAIRLKPDYAEAYNNLGNALREKREWDGAIDACRRALRINPDFAAASVNLGSALRGKGELDEAIAAYRQANRLMPDFAEGLSNLGNALKEKGRLEESIAAYRQAIRLKPDLVVAHCNLAHTLLLLGDFEQGWPEYDWRLKMGSWQSPLFQGRRWSGEELEGKTLLLWGEQGYGDVIQFVRYAAMAAHRAGKIVVWCQRELVDVLRSNPDLGDVVPSDAGVPAHDFQCPLMSLPRVFNTRLETIPASTFYLSSDPVLVESWEKRLGSSQGRLKVGLAWAGNPRFQDDRTRSLTLERLAPLGAVRGVTFYSLQKGAAGEQAKNPPAGMELVDLGPELKDFADTAAVMSLMDLIITTDTSVPHLAGALGRPAWVMLQFVPDFRWLLERDDSPWYPTMRLFRQKSPGDWNGAIGRVAEALAAHRG
jgi:tetratricopeptide (TPR) repeat protein